MSAVHTESLKEVCVSAVQLPAEPPSSGVQALPQVQLGDKRVPSQGWWL